MKTMRKVFALLMALSMILALAITANAEGETTEAAPGTITINPGTPDDATANKPTYTYYVMMKASVGENGAVSYYVETEALANALVGTGYFTATRVGTTNHWNIGLAEDKENATGEQVAAALQGIKGSAIATDSVSEDDDYTIALGYDAYVLIESSLGTKLVVDTYTTKEVNEKNEYPSITKDATETSAEIGQEIHYSIPVVIPETVSNEKDIVITDTLSKGLTMNTAITTDNAAVTGLAWTLSGDGEDGAKVYTVTIPAATAYSLKGTTLTLSYTATVNEEAVTVDTLTNTAQLNYDEYSSVVVGEGDADVKTFSFSLAKTDGENALGSIDGDPIVFSLTNAAGEYYTAPTDPDNINEDRFTATSANVSVGTDGSLKFEGLAAGTYTLTELETREGYNLLAEPITVTVGADGTITASGADVSGDTITVVNNQGVELPSTGGIGTTIFTVVGATLMIGAAVLFITKKRSVN